MSSEKKYDPNLREAVEEIRSILKRRNIGGFFALASDTHAEFAYLLDNPSWSTITWEKSPTGDDMIRIRSKIKTDPERELPRMLATTHMIWSVHDMLGNAFLALEGLKEQIQTFMTVEAESRIGTPPDSYPGDGQ